MVYYISTPFYFLVFFLSLINTWHLMRKIKFCALFILATLLFLSQQGIAQSYYFRNYSVDDGLPFINVSIIYQDHKGNLWSGGYGGLSKFDGITFTNYTPKNGLLDHAVTGITEDNQDNLWIGTIKGVNKLSGKKFTSYTTSQGLISNVISSVLKDSKGNIWFGTDKGISKLTDGAFINFSAQTGLINNTINCMYEDASGNMWIGTNKGISVLNGKKITNYSLAQGLPAKINSITEDAQHTICVATAEGLYKLQDNKFVGKKELANFDIKTILKDNNGALWLGTNQGLKKIENEDLYTYTIHKNKNSELISCLYLDFEHNLWIGTYAGLFKYRANPFVSYGAEDGLTDQFIFGILRDSKNQLWVGSKNNGLFKQQQDGRFHRQPDVKANTVNAIYEFKKDIFWLATSSGLILHNGEHVIPPIDSSSAFRHPVNCFYKDSKNNLWIGGNDEIYRYDGKKFARYSIKGKIPKTDVWAIVEDQQGTLWVGTYMGGLLRFDGKKFSECTKELGFKHDSYLTSLIDKEGYIYWGTMDGVYMYKPETKQFTHFNESDGLNSDLVYSLNFGKRQNEIWAGTNQGLSRIDISEFKIKGKKTVVPFGKEEGFSGVECNSGGWVDEDASIWFGTVNGLIKYDPSKYIRNSEESKTSIRGFRLFYIDTLLDNTTHLTHNNNNLTIYFSGVCLTNPAKVQYSHILQGFEKNWSPPSKERLVTYSNLPPGSYTFKLISANNEGIWNKTSENFSFTIDKPFWKTWWFIALSAVFMVTAFTLAIRYRIRNIKNRERRKTELNKRIANIESQALRAQMNPHFIFNTLSSIQHYISNNNTDAALKYLSKFAKLMRKIMENSKLPMITVAEELNALNLYLELEIMRFDKKFEYIISTDPEIDQNYDRIPSMLIQPYVENAIVHGLLPKQGRGKITIALQKQEDTILCIIEDNGIGRENAKQFKKHRVQHKSMGMSITQDRLDILNAGFNSNISCEIIDLFDKGEPSGTRVRLIIPLEVNE